MRNRSEGILATANKRSARLAEPESPSILPALSRAYSHEQVVGAAVDDVAEPGEPIERRDVSTALVEAHHRQRDAERRRNVALAEPGGFAMALDPLTKCFLVHNRTLHFQTALVEVR